LRSPFFPYTTLFRSPVPSAVNYDDTGGQYRMPLPDGDAYVFHISVSAEGIDTDWSDPTPPITIPLEPPLNLTAFAYDGGSATLRSEEHTSELQSLAY